MVRTAFTDYQIGASFTTDSFDFAAVLAELGICCI